MLNSDTAKQPLEAQMNNDITYFCVAGFGSAKKK